MKRIAVLIAPYDDAGRRLLLGVRDYARTATDWRVWLGEPSEAELPEVRAWGPDGIIVYPTSPHLRAVAEWGLPVTAIGSAMRGLGVSSHSFEADVIGRLAARHLLARGYSRLAFVGRTHLTPWEAFEAEAGGRVDRLDALPMTWDRRHEWKDWATGAQRRELREWLSGLDYPLGVFALRDSFGRGILEACADLGLRVPDKVAVLGMNNDRIQCELAVPTLSSIEPPYQLVGYRASASLAALMAGRPLPSFDPLPPPQLVVRQSTDAVATDDPDVVAAMRYMRENLGQPIGTGRIARAMGISQRSLERHFKRALDTTPGRELKRLRLEMARQMLADPDQSVESVAEACGLVSAQYLARWLKRETGHAPAEFRRRNNITDADA